MATCRPIAAPSVVLGLLLLSGCVAEGLRDPNVKLDVTMATVRPVGYCGVEDPQADTTGWCHVFTVEVTNRNEEAEINAGFLSWAAADDAGVGYRARGTEGPDLLDPGATGTVKVLVPAAGSLRFTQLRFKQLLQASPILTPIPSYCQYLAPGDCGEEPVDGPLLDGGLNLDGGIGDSGLLDAELPLDAGDAGSGDTGAVDGGLELDSALPIDVGLPDALLPDAG